MGRVIRRVPPDWEHPEDENGHCIPTFDEYVGDVDVAAWEAEYERSFDEDAKSVYRERSWTEEEATAYQVYENVTEGTPISPVFETKGEMREWLLSRGHSETAVDKFIEDEYAFTMMIISGPEGTKMKMGIDALDMEGE